MISMADSRTNTSSRKPPGSSQRRGPLSRPYRRRKHLSGTLEVAVVSGVILVFSGAVRGPRIDCLIVSALHALQEWLRAGLLSILTVPAVATGVVVVLNYIGFLLLLLLLSNYVRKVPCYLGYLVFGEFDRRRGRRLATLGLLFGITIPISLTLTLTSYSEVSLYGWFHFTAGYAFIRFSCEPVAMNSTLNWHARIRTAVENPTDDIDADAEGE
jgi:hypothetical protein